MKVSYKLISNGVGYEPLFDENVTGSTIAPPSPIGAGKSPPFSARFSQAIQEEALFRSNASFRAARGNISCTWSCSFEVAYSNETDAFASVARIGTILMNQKMHLQVQAGSAVLYFPNAVIQDYVPNSYGSSIIHTLTFKTDNVTTDPV